jgi:hypothetical protein
MTAKEKAAAVLTLKDADKMTAKGRRQIAAWLRKQADALQAEGNNYASRFRARYLYR